MKIFPRRTLKSEYQQYGSIHGQTRSARQDPEGTFIPSGERQSLRGAAPARPLVIAWVESSKDPWDMPVEVRPRLTLVARPCQTSSVLFPDSPGREPQIR